MSVPRIVSVAIQLDGKVYSVPAPGRHIDVLRAGGVEALPSGIEKYRLARGVQGFLTVDGQFLDRKQAAEYALACGQIQRLKFQPDALFSEDLW